MLDVELPAADSQTIGLTSGTYTYPWGKCRIFTQSSASSFIECIFQRNEEDVISYQKKFLHAEIMSNSTICLAYGTDNPNANTMAQRVCRKDTQSSRNFNCRGSGVFGEYCFLYYD